ncbi:mediator of RNA polymerase II transcription subunit 20-like isoform X2 [Acanthaster planci]|uniref:Mediator of RNA polymerase II transcription subunit 20 n=1 Tax=Acanthaster planci TaxID=133434 RepID=A0A8B7ZVD5_ACAPL|nr:mediator of RNA polymerase II transcription subunit 20-like isoform X2 [Acanthaster planci]
MNAMGVTCVCQWPVTESRTVQQTVEMLTRRIEVLGAVKAGNFCVDCETYQSTQTINSTKLVHLMHNSEQPLTCFGITDTGACLITDGQFEGIMQKLKGFYTPRKSARVESKGQRFELGDFLVKIGIVSIGPHTKGILVEVEYTPCIVVPDCWNLLHEFMQSFMGNQSPSLPTTLLSKQDMPVTPIDTMVQYLEHFNNFKKGSAGR